MQLFYNPNINTHTQQIVFTREESRHIVRVLRKKENDVLHLTNGKGYLFSAKIMLANDKKCTASVLDIEQKDKSWSYYLHMVVAPTKNMVRFEWFLEKAVEIGVDEITPIICQNSERKTVKMERLEKIMQAAMKQSLKFTLPKLNEPVKFSEFITQKFEGTVCIAHCEPTDKTSLKKALKPDSKTTILIGPEGDFSSEEVKKATLANCTPISLGSSRLRTETAALVAVQNVAFMHQE